MHPSQTKLCVAALVVTFFGTVYSGTASAGVSLGDLLAGDSIVAGQTTFSNFALVDDSGTVSPSASNITVNGIAGVDRAGLFFDAGNELFLAPGLDSIIFQLSYDIDTSGVFLDGETLALFGRAGAGVEGLIDVSSAIESNNALLSEISAQIDPLFGIDEPVASQSFAGTSSVNATTSVTLFADANLTAPEDVLLDGFTQSFSIAAVPEPSSFSIAVIGFGCLAFRRRRHHSNR